jgi:hypothetical protein
MVYNFQNHWVYGLSSGILNNWKTQPSSKQLLSCTHEAEWTPFQTHYFSENVVAPGIEPEPLEL